MLTLLVLANLVCTQSQFLEDDRALVQQVLDIGLKASGARPDQIEYTLDPVRLLRDQGDWRSLSMGDFAVRIYKPLRWVYDLNHTNGVTKRPVGFDPAQEGIGEEAAKAIATSIYSKYVFAPFEGDARSPRMEGDRFSFSFGQKMNGLRLASWVGSSIQIDRYSGCPVSVLLAVPRMLLERDPLRLIPSVPLANARATALSMYYGYSPMPSALILGGEFILAVPRFDEPSNLTPVHIANRDASRLQVFYLLTVKGSSPRGGVFWQRIYVDGTTGAPTAIETMPAEISAQSVPSAKVNPVLDGKNALSLLLGDACVPIKLLESEARTNEVKWVKGLLCLGETLQIVQVSQDGKLLAGEGRVYRLDPPLKPAQVERLKARPFPS